MENIITYRRLFLTVTLSILSLYGAYAQTGLFESDEVLPVKLKGSFRGLLNDRIDAAKDFPLILVVNNQDSSSIEIPVQVRTRGKFRRMRENCFYPPLLIQFPKKGPHDNSVFREQKKLKLVMPCKDDNYVVKEWLVYKIYNLVTPNSFRARLVQVTLEDDKSKKTIGKFYGIVLEEEKQLAKRNGMIAIDKKLSPLQIQPNPFLTMAVFEYLIGNTDWSVQYLHNIKLLAKDSLTAPVTVPYDFDHSGIVNTPYAMPAEQLNMSSVRERRYRGHCMPDLKVFEPVLALFNSLKSEIYNVYSNCPLVDDKYKKRTIQFIDDFYSTINNPKQWQKEFSYPCEKKSTSDVIIKGLNN